MLAIYAALASFALLVPRPIDEGFTPWVRGVLAFLRNHGLGLLSWLGYDVVEYAAHAVVFAPLGILAVVAFGRRMSWLAVLLLLGACWLVEYAQSIMGSAEPPSTPDLLLNTAGALAGAAVGYWAATPTRARRSSS
ncbi:hypothetical protein GCM10023152_26000 [Agromyces bauzanensis]|uniref:VanZ-like domain-containing protein n=1 Tax=Agromyces bauzanensis TaxID=1308924 RepID=A0A917PT46_9MICO|nr:hypothetical protein GCM10011372_30790 [Agromyces bauzanensis]